ncbi:hypothetical protein OPIT5_24475 [Opitutaceae bacterium TAV5]|nr:hypothetical protein OPIT5_24475 [Opitutaceae bacterium TAV5]
MHSNTTTLRAVSGKATCHRKLCLFLATFVLSSVLARAAETITFRDGVVNAFSGDAAYDGTSDVTIRTNNQNNYGGLVGASFSSSGYIALLGFDLSSLTGKVSAVDNVTLTLGIQGTNVVANQGLTITLSAYVIDPANAGWQAHTGNKNGAVAAEAGEVSGAALSTGERAWASGDNFGPADRASTAAASISFTTAAATQYITLSLPSSIVMSWINSPGNNAGLAFTSDNAIAFAFYTSEHSTLAAHPALTFDYTPGAPVPEPATSALLTAGMALAGIALCRRGFRGRRAPGPEA